MRSASRSEIQRADRNPLALAGLWRSHAEFGLTLTIITTAPNACMLARDCPMEEFQEPAHWDAWPGAEDEDPAWRTALLRPAAEHVLTGNSVSPRRQQPTRTYSSRGPSAPAAPVLSPVRPSTVGRRRVCMPIPAGGSGHG